MRNSVPVQTVETAYEQRNRELREAQEEKARAEAADAAEEARIAALVTEVESQANIFLINEGCLNCTYHYRHWSHTYLLVF